MKRGFRLVYHKSIKEVDLVRDCLEKKLNHFNSESSYKVGYFSSRSYYGRGIFGLQLYMNEKDDKGVYRTIHLPYTFRRLVKNRRIFGVCPIELLEPINQPIDLEQCMCVEHLGGTKVKLKDGYIENDWVIFNETGDIKG